MRFRAEQHLRRPAEIRTVRETGRRLDGRAFVVWWKGRAAGTSPARVCVIASTAAVGDAVRRNRAKRRLREVFRTEQAAVPAGCDLLLIARAAAVDRPLPELREAFRSAGAQIARATSAPPA